MDSNAAVGQAALSARPPGPQPMASQADAPAPPRGKARGGTTIIIRLIIDIISIN